MRYLFTIVLTASVVAACGRTNDAPAVKPEGPTLDVTSWTDKTELFMEHPPLVTGQTTRFAVHLTRMADFTALNAGKPAIEMTPESGGSPVTLPGSEPLRPGAFRVEGAMPAAGRYKWALLVNAPGLSDRHDLGVTTVFDNEAANNNLFLEAHPHAVNVFLDTQHAPDPPPLEPRVQVIDTFER